MKTKISHFFSLVLVSTLLIAGGLHAQTQLGTDIDGEAAGDNSGNSVSFNAAGTRVAIGAFFNDGTDSGHVRVYEYNGANWVQIGTDIDGEAAGDWSGVSVSFNDAGTRVAIGALFNDGNGSNSGHVRVYEYNGANWVQIGTDIDGEAAADWSGNSVSFNAAGTRVAIGAPFNDGNGSNSGHVRVYEYNGANWVQIGTDIDGEAAVDNSGRSVSFNAAGTRVAIGADGNDGNGSKSGHVRVYEYNSANWVQLGTDIDGEEAGDWLGWSVSFNDAGTRVAIGALFNDGNGSFSGHVRVYEYKGANWVQLGTDIDGEAVGDRSGRSVSFNAAGTRVAIGAESNDGNGSNSGHVRVYEYNGANWVQIGTDIDGEAAGDFSGISVSFNDAGTRVAIGANFNDGNGNNSGHVRVYSLDITPLVITCPADITVNIDPGVCGAVVTYADPVGSSDTCGATTITQIAGLASGSIFLTGTTTNTFEATDACGNTETCSFTVTVEDNIAPVLTVITGPIILFPPDHNYDTIELSQIFVSVSDNCADLSIDDVYISDVSSDEEEDLPGGFDGNTVDDIVIAPDCRSVQLRRERNFRRNGRVYTINLTVDDGNGNIGVASVQVYVPRSPNGTAIDDGMAYEEICGNGFGPLSIPVVYDEIDRLLNLDDYDNYSLDIRFWPNPSDGYFNIKLKTNNYSDNVRLQVYDVNSRLLHYNEFAPEDEYRFGRELAAGVYIVKIMQAGKIRSARVVKY
jgi:HYR domain-containing protein/type IX secretion system substrate protein